jgi:hypothetical protein
VFGVVGVYWESCGGVGGGGRLFLMADAGLSLCCGGGGGGERFWPEGGDGG